MCKKTSTDNGESDNFPVFTGAYLGQEKPGKIPEMFAPEFFKQEVHSAPVFSHDGSEFFWDLMNDDNTLYMKMNSDSVWTAPVEAPFASRFGTGSPCFSPDGKKLFFTSWEAASRAKMDDKENIWYIEKIGDNWSECFPLPDEVNFYNIHWQFSIASNGNLYFAAEREIYKAEPVNGEYTNVENLGSPVNSLLYESTPYIAPDESYIIFSRFGGSLVYSDLYICFKNQNGEWDQVKSMGSVINTGVNEMCPQVSPDGKYFFFIRNDNTGMLRIFWADASIIDDLR